MAYVFLLPTLLPEFSLCDCKIKSLLDAINGGKMAQGKMPNYEIGTEKR